MQDRPAPATPDREVGHLNPQKTYAFIYSIGTGVSLGSLGLGAGQVIPKNTSLITSITVEGFCSTMSLVTLLHELVNLCSLLCCRRDGQIVEATSHPPTQYSLYLTFRAIANLASLVGVTLVALDLSEGATTAKTTIGFALIAINAFIARQLTASAQKPSGVVLSGIEGDVEQGRLAPEQRSLVRAAPHAVIWQHRRGVHPRHDVQPAEEFDIPLETMQPVNDAQPPPVVVAQAAPVARAAASGAALPSHQFFQAEPVVAEAPLPATPVAPVPEQGQRPHKAGWKLVPRKGN